MEGLREVDNILEVKHVSASYKDKHGEVSVLRDVSLTVGAGEIVGLVGESGSGKTTLGLCVLGEVPFVGRISVCGIEVRPYDKRSRKERLALSRSVQAVFQDPLASLDPLRRVSSALTEPLAIHGIGKRAEHFAAACLMARRVGLDDALLRRLPHELSGGQRQRILIASALMLHPALLIADEVTSSLDSASCQGVLDLLSSLNHEEGLSILFISHDMNATNMLCSRVISLETANHLPLDARP